MNFSTKFHWQPNWKILLFVAVFLPLTVALGFWQLDRADQKRAILAAQEMQAQLPAFTSENWQQDSLNHLRQVDLQLSFEAYRHLLLANRLVEGKVGYEVISLAYSSNQPARAQLVNRGWVPASFDRNDLPEIESVAGLQRVQGYYYCSEPNSMIRQSTEFDGSWPAIVFDLDDSAMQQIFPDEGQRPVACEIRLDASSPLAFYVDWQIVNQPVAKHIGYAVQWFSMAFALIILALFSNSNLANFFRSEKTTNQSGTSGHTNHDK